jgi:starch phosphorylase
MKVLVNGGLNLSELDGWWAEAFLPEAGWALGDGLEHSDIAAQDALEAEQLYRLLETEVVPCFYTRDARGLPRAWIARMRESMSHLTTRYSSNRMLREYTENYYLPLAAAVNGRSDAVAIELEQWHAQLAQHWPRIHFGNVNYTAEQGEYRFEVQVYLEELPSAALRVELFAEQGARRVPLERGAALLGATNAYNYSGSVAADRPVANYTPRIVAYHAQALLPLEANFILWYR